MECTSSQEFAMFRLIEDERQEIVLTAAGIQGFFVASEDTTGRVELLGPSHLPDARSFHDVELQVLDNRGEVIGAYYVGQVDILDRQAADLASAAVVEASFGGYSLPFPYAAKVWCRWAANTPFEYGEWRRLPPDQHSSWLHVVQTAWFQAGNMATRYGSGRLCLVEGSGLANIDSVYCELGEAINGPAGYFGSGLDALVDCLRTATATGTFELVWRNLESTAECVGEEDVRQVMSVFQEFGVKVRTEG